MLLVIARCDHNCNIIRKELNYTIFDELVNRFLFIIFTGGYWSIAADDFR